MVIALSFSLPVGKCIQTDELVAIKLEPVKTRHPQLAYEYNLYRILKGRGTHSKSNS
jgi:hypothetical protein